MNMPFTEAQSGISLKCYAYSEEEGGGIIDGSIPTGESEASSGIITSENWSDRIFPADYKPIRILSASITVDNQRYTINFA